MSGARAPMALIVSALLAQLCACSLILDELDTTCSESLTDCAAFNEKYGRDTGPEGDCFIYQCRPNHNGCEQRARDLDWDGFADEKTCAKQVEGPLDCNDQDDAGRPDGGEVCDQADNDCDGLVDEGALNRRSLEAPAPIALDFSGVTRVSHTLDARGELVLTLTNQAATTRIASRSGGFKPSDMALPNCNGGCTIRDLALSVSESFWFALGVNTKGCSAGQLRIGVNKSVSALTWDGVCKDCETQIFWPTLASRSSAGFDIASSAPCTQSGLTTGASAPSLAILTDRETPKEGLALWRAGDERPDAVLPLVGMPLQVVASKGDRERVVAVQGAWSSSEPLDGVTSGREAAIIRPWYGKQTSGYFVAYDSEDGVEIAFVPTGGAASLSDFASVARLPIVSPGAQHIALALSDPEQTPLSARLALAWLAPVTGGSTVMLATVAHDFSADPPFELVSCAALLDDAREQLAGLDLLYVKDGFSVPPQPMAGGWVISWVEGGRSPQRLFAARLPGDAVQPSRACRARLEGSLLEPPFLLDEASSIDSLFMFSDKKAELGYAYVSREGGERLNIGELRCRESQDVMQGVPARK